MSSSSCRGSTERVVREVRDDRKWKFEKNMVVWGVRGSYPWWPGVVLDSKTHEQSRRFEPLPPATTENRMVKFFNHVQEHAVLNIECLCEFTTNTAKVKLSTPYYREAVLTACEQAKEFIERQGTLEQREMLPKLEGWDIRKAKKVPKRTRH